MKGFGERLRTLRGEFGVTQKQLADFLSQAQSSIAYWERNEREPSISVLKKLCSFFSVTADYLIGLEDEIGQKIPYDVWKIEFGCKGDKKDD